MIESDAPKVIYNEALAGLWMDRRFSAVREIAAHGSIIASGVER